MLVAEGVVVRTDADCVALESDDKGIAVTVDCLQGDRVVRGTHVLIAVGRRPNTDDLSLSAAGAEVDSRGYVSLGDMLRTDVDGIWAVGECTGRGVCPHTDFNPL